VFQCLWTREIGRSRVELKPGEKGAERKPGENGVELKPVRKVHSTTEQSESLVRKAHSTTWDLNDISRKDDLLMIF
jgi:hypothetical protein